MIDDAVSLILKRYSRFSHKLADHYEFSSCQFWLRDDVPTMSLFLEPKSEFAKSKHRTHVEMTELEIHIAIEDDGLFFESYYIDSLYAKALVHKSSMLYALNKVSDEILRKAYLYDQEAVLEET